MGRTREQAHRIRQGEECSSLNEAHRQERQWRRFWRHKHWHRRRLYRDGDANSGDANTSFIHTLDRLFMYNAAGDFGSGGHENAYCNYSYSVTSELGSGPTPAEFMDGLLNKAKDKVDDCALVTGGWTTTLYARFDSGETYLKGRVASPSSLQECQNIPRRNNLTSTQTRKWCPSTTLYYVSQLMKMVSISALHHLAI